MYSKCLKSETLESGSMYGQFVLNGLKSGHGISIGNLLRRVLLDDLGGTAITAIRIAGVRDEFTLITGVREDILEILLNLKGIVFKSTTEDVSLGRLKIKGPAVVTANSIELPSNVKIINPNHYIATISDSSFLEMEVKFEYGFGYRLATQTFCVESEDF
jgi:DNA-directed RNA polymerase subunit alpha